MMNRLTEKELDKLHEATIKILDNTGIQFLEHEAVELLKKGGCKISSNNRVHFTEKLVEWALSIAPKNITLHNRKGDPAIELSGRRAYYGNGSDLLYIIDHRTGKRRQPLYKDVKEMMVLLENLKHIDFVMSGFIPFDLPKEKFQPYQMLAMLEHTSKPIIYVTTDLQNTEKKIKMAEIVAGGADAFSAKPFAANYINISNPLRHNPESIQKLMWLSSRGLPFIYRPSIVTRGISTPVTWAAFLAVNNAAGLAGLVLSQLVKEGAPFIRCGCGGGTFDMRQMVGLHAAPEIRGFNEDMAEYYKLPRFGIGGLTGSKTVDQQAAFEAALTLITSSISGAQLIHDVGYMDNGTTGSFEQLLICHEMIEWVKQYMEKLTINEETLALNIIDETAKRTGADFLDSDNTLAHYKEDVYPDLTDRSHYQTWEKEGALDIKARARERVNELLNNGIPVFIEKNVRKELGDVI